MDVIAFKMLGMDDAITVWIGFVFGETRAGEDGKANTKCLQIKDSLL